MSPCSPNPGVIEPLVTVYLRYANEFGSPIILVDDWTPPLDHLAFDIHWAGRRGMDRHAMTSQVKLSPLGMRQFEHPHEHRWHPLAVGHAVMFDEPQRLQRIEACHHHHRSAWKRCTHSEKRSGAE